jgi:tRNA/tmRNA/rRNA uracil-C5-methylase (TrmA/RlmC/RlmD family)
MPEIDKRLDSMPDFKDAKGPILTHYAHSLKQKAERLKLGLSEISCDHLFSNLVPTPITRGFRSRAKYKVFGNPESFSLKGTDPRQGEVPYEDALWLFPLWGKKLISQIIDVISAHLKDYWVDGFEVQLSHGHKHAHLTLSVKKQDLESYSDLAHYLLEKVGGLCGVSIPSKKKDYSKPYLIHTIGRKHFYSHYTAFFQSNSCLTTRLVNEVKQRCESLDFSRVLDLYCGVGLFSLSVAENAIPVIGVDINKRAVDSARLNAQSLNFNRVSFMCCPVENFLPNASINAGDLIIIDPPRSGCPASLIRIVSERESEFVCSISCDLSSHLRDLKKWIGNGYDVQSIAALDMFPFTEFLETVAFLRRTSCQG